MSTHGILFLGTPHSGVDDSASFQQTLHQIFTLKSEVNEDLLKELQNTSQTLQTQLTLYTPLSTDFRTVFFYEVRPTGTHGIVILFQPYVILSLMSVDPGCPQILRCRCWGYRRRSNWAGQRPPHACQLLWRAGRRSQHCCRLSTTDDRDRC